MLSILITSAEEMEDLGERFAGVCQGLSSIYLLGDLGAGKTTFVRGFLRGLGHEGPVKSPTYTLVESYNLMAKELYHFDLYRLNDPEELEAMGVRDYFNEKALCLLEWPEKAEDLLPEPDVMFDLEYEGEARQVHIKALSEPGVSCLSKVKDQLSI